MAVGALLGAGAGLRAGAVAGFAVFVAGELKGFFAAEGRFLKGNAQVVPQVVALHRRVPALGRAGPHAAAEQLVENIAHAAEAAEIKAARAAAEARLGPVEAELVVARALFRVAQHLVGFVQLLEALLRLLVVGVQVGVAFLGQLAVRLFNVFGRGVLGNAHDLVVVSLCCHCFLNSQLVDFHWVFLGETALCGPKSGFPQTPFRERR